MVEMVFGGSATLRYPYSVYTCLAFASIQFVSSSRSCLILIIVTIIFSSSPIHRVLLVTDPELLRCCDLLVFCDILLMLMQLDISEKNP